jgi:hypothetical protein
MSRLYLLVWLVGIVSSLHGQSFELTGLQESYRGTIGETIKVPLHFKNNSDKTVTLIIKNISNQLGTSQKHFFCPDQNCLDASVQDFLVKLEPNQTLNSLQIGLDAGLAQGASSIRYLAINKYNPSESFEFDLNFMVEERAEKQNIYSSPRVLLHDVYPNPVTADAFIEYSILDSHVKAKIVIHNILGSPMEEYALPSSENKVKILAEALNTGIYFYTLYIDNEGVVTRKLIVKK